MTVSTRFAALDRMPSDEPAADHGLYSNNIHDGVINIDRNIEFGTSASIPRRKFFKPREEEPPRKYPRLEKGQFLAKSELPEGYADLITSLYHDCKTWYEKGRAMEKMYEDERARCALLQDHVGRLESDLSGKVTEMRKIFEMISPLVTSSQQAINTWQLKVDTLQKCTLGIRLCSGLVEEEVAHTPIMPVDAPAVDETPGIVVDGIQISAFYEKAVFGAEHANLISSRGLDFMLQRRDDGCAVVDQTIHLFKIDTGNQDFKDKYARRISNGFCLLQYDLQLCLKKAFGDSSVKNFGNHTQRTNKFVLTKADLLPKLTDSTIDELVSKKIIMENKPSQEFCFIPYADVVQVLTKFAQHNCRQAQTTARLDCIKSLLDKFHSRHVSNEEAPEGQDEASRQSQGRELSLDRSEGLSHLPLSSDCA